MRAGAGVNRLMLTYQEGYRKALVDLAGWICNPAHPLDKKLCTPERLERLLHFIVDDLDSFMECPDAYAIDYLIEKRKGLKLWKPEKGWESEQK